MRGLSLAVHAPSEYRRPRLSRKRLNIAYARPFFRPNANQCLAMQIEGILDMKSVVLAFAIAALAALPADAHGGGCRKSSPPGQCCHMDNSVGAVHCH